MAALIQRLRHFRPNLQPHLRHHPYPIHQFSSSPDPPPTPPPEPESTRSSFSSYVSDVKSSLQKEPPPQNRPRKPLSLTNPSPTQSSPHTIDLEEIQRNLSEFRRRSAPPTPSDASGKPVSFEFLFKKNLISNPEGLASGPGKSVPRAADKESFNAIRESISQFRPSSPRSRVDGGRRKPGETYNLQPALFGKGKKEIGDDNSKYFLNVHDYPELGRRLKMFRPEKRDKSFSLQELNDRLVKVRKNEEKENESRIGGVFNDLRSCIQSMGKDDNNKKSLLQKVDVLGHLGGTPKYMMSPPKEHLVEQYLHPDHMSSAEKLKLELQKVREEFKMSESDCGSARVQVAQLTTKIKHLSNVLQKKDKHSRKGLIAMVQRRKKLLKYLRRTDWDSYCLVLSKLGLRDNPDIKA